MSSEVSPNAVLDSLREREEFLRRILASTDDCIKILDLDARLTFMSENGQRALAIPDFELVRNADWLAFWHGDDRAAAEAAVAAASAGETGQFEGYFETLAGEPKWFHVVVSPMLGSDGRPERLLAVSRDITASRRDRALIEKNAALYRGLAEAVPAIVFSADVAGDLDYVNRHWTDYTGLSLEQSLGFTWGPLVHPDEADATTAAWAASVRERREHTATFRLRRHDGVYRWHVARAVPMRDAHGEVERWFGTAFDVDEGKRNAERLKQLYLREHHVASALQDAALPRSLPDVPGCTFDAVYLPGKSEAEIGGDWYDAFVLADGRILISIGDVLGSGLHAAVTMTKIREAIRTAALADPDPAAVLALADRALELDDPEKIATAIVGLLDVRAGTLTCAAAGHPGPLMHVPGGGVQDPFVDRALPLGLGSGDRAPSRTIALEPGTFVAFFTDGLVESTRDVLEGEQRLRAALADPAIRGAQRPASAIREVMLSNGPRDDVAILTLALSAN